MNFHCKVVLMLCIAFCVAGSLWASDINNAIKKNDLKMINKLVTAHADLLDKKSENGMTPLCYASLEGKLDIVDFLLEKGADPLIGDNEGSQSLHNAAVGGHLDVVKRLMKAGITPDLQDDNGVNALHFALNYRRFQVADYLIDHTKDLEIRNNNGWTAMLYAVIAGDQKCVEKLIKRGAKVNARTNSGLVPLHSAASYGNYNIFKLLVDNGADIHAKNDDGQTPIFWALNPNCISVAKLLIEKGADVTMKDSRGATPFHNACQRGSVQMAQLHLKHGADLHAMDDGGWTPLIYASFAHRGADIVKFLLEQGAKVNVKPPKGAEYFRSALHCAVAGGSLDAAKLLVDHGADIDALDSEGATPLLTAVARGRMDIAEYLVEKGCDLDAKDTFLSRSPLHGAAIMGHSELASLMIDKGADVLVTDRKNKTPMDYAVYHGFKKLAHKLAENGADKGKMKKLEKTMGLVNKPMPEGEAVIWHLEHSGWAVKTKNHMLVFDYAVNEGRQPPKGAALANGHICTCELKDQNLCVFASHVHGDHYHESIFKWKDKVPNTQYVMGFQPAGIAADKYTLMGPRTTKLIDDIKITTIKANDLGVGFVVEVDGLNIFHPGDHANRNADLSGDYTPEIDFVADLGLDIDVAFFPVSGCGFGDPDNVRLGVHYAIEKLNPRVLFPMHAGLSTHRYQEFADKTAKKNYATKIGCAVHKGDRFFYSTKKSMPTSMN